MSKITENLLNVISIKTDYSNGSYIANALPIFELINPVYELCDRTNALFELIDDENFYYKSDLS